MVALGAGFAIGASRGEIRMYRRFGFTELISALSLPRDESSDIGSVRAAIFLGNTEALLTYNLPPRSKRTSNLSIFVERSAIVKSVLLPH
jgi:hypothetical protein